MWISASTRHRPDPDASPCGVVMFGDDGRLLAANDTVLRWLQLDADAMEGLTLDGLVSPAARVLLHLAVMPLLTTRGRVDEVTLALRSRAGEDLHVIVGALRRETAHGPVCHAVFTRIDERRKVEEELARSRRVGDEVPGVVFQLEIDLAGRMRFTRLGEGAARLLGLSPEALREDAHPFFEAVHPDDRVRLLSLLTRESLVGEAGQLDFRIHRPGQPDWSWHTAHATARRLADGSTLWNGYLADVTGQRRLEETLRANHQLRLTGMLAAGIAHDFNNALGSIDGLAELCLLEAAGQARLERNLHGIRQGARKAARLVRQMLDFARQSPQVLEGVSLRGLLERAREGLEAQLPAGVTLEIDAPEEVPVVADPLQLERAMLQLVDNAGHAMRARGGVVRLLLAPAAAGAADNPLRVAAARLDVLDSGHGIAPEHLPDIFQPFFTTKAVGEGTGLGLSAVHGIVTSHGGRVEVCSHPGGGSRFSVWIPVTPPAAGDGAFSGTS